MDSAFEAEELRINLGSIKRIDNAITGIIDKSAHVAFYKFDGSSWHKTNVEGSLFVFSRSIQPYYGFVIQNRRNMDNVCEALIDGVEFQRASQFLLYKTQNSIHSIWFNEEAECIKIARILQQLMLTRTENPAKDRRNSKPVHDTRPAESRERRNEQQRDNRGSVPRNNTQSKPPKKTPSPKQSPKKSSDILDLFHQAHKRYSCSDVSDQETSKVTILKRETKLKRGEREVKREEELMSLVKPGERSSPEEEPVRLSAGYGEKESKKAITFQELMNSAKPKSSPTPSSSPDLDKVSLSDSNQDQPSSYKEHSLISALYNNTGPVQDLASSAHLLMSPMDFQRSPPPVKTFVDIQKTSPVKRTLFPTATPVPAPTPVPVPEKELEQFKKMLITAIQTDRELVRQMYSAMLAQDKR